MTKNQFLTLAAALLGAALLLERSALAAPGDKLVPVYINSGDITGHGPFRTHVDFPPGTTRIYRAFPQALFISGTEFVRIRVDSALARDDGGSNPCWFRNVMAGVQYRADRLAPGLENYDGGGVNVKMTCSQNVARGEPGSRVPCGTWRGALVLYFLLPGTVSLP